MRYALMFILLASPAIAGDRNAPQDAYYGCLVGQGAVELHYGVAQPKAFGAALKKCAKLSDAAEKADPEEGVEWVRISASEAIDKLGAV
jgi:hypothetical protein